ncbi:hypothetical protein FJD35_10295 [Pseudomonas mandelii]|nr:hypothetical protein FJD35_10295 [Pseudomonas mandelii]
MFPCYCGECDGLFAGKPRSYRYRDCRGIGLGTKPVGARLAREAFRGPTPVYVFARRPSSPRPLQPRSPLR